MNNPEQGSIKINIGRRTAIRKKVWKPWTLRLGDDGHVERYTNGVVVLQSIGYWICKLSPTEARQLYLKLASDYRD